MSNAAQVRIRIPRSILVPNAKDEPDVLCPSCAVSISRVGIVAINDTDFGLCLCNKLVKLTGYDIRLASADEEKTFEIELATIRARRLPTYDEKAGDMCVRLLEDLIANRGIPEALIEPARQAAHARNFQALDEILEQIERTQDIMRPS